jgi:hypothetical protein
MKKNALYLLIGCAGLLPIANTVSAASVGVAVTIQQVDDEGNLVAGTAGTKEWALGDPKLVWTQTSTIEADGKVHVLNDLANITGTSNQIRWKNGGTFGTAADIYINDLKYDVDPMLSFNFSLNNFTAYNQVYTIAYNTPLAPTLSGTVNSSASLTATLTDAAGVAGAKIAPANGNGNIMRSWDLTVNGNQISKNVDVGSQFIVGSGITASNTWSAVNTLECGIAGDACETMSTVLTLMLSKGDKVTLQGSVVQTVPVPASVWLFGSALALLLRMRRKQNKV